MKNGFAQTYCTTFKKAEASLAKKPALGSPDKPQTSLPTVLSNNLSQPQRGSSLPTPQRPQYSEHKEGSSFARASSCYGLARGSSSCKQGIKLLVCS